jgi:hypothetical protein
MLVLETIEQLISGIESNIYYDNFPDDAPDNITTLYLYPSTEPDYRFGQAKATYIYPNIQVRVRDIDYVNGYNRINVITDILDGLTDINDIILIQLKIIPCKLRTDEKDRHEFVVSFKLTINN